MLETPAGKRTSFEYDDSGRVVAVTRPDGLQQMFDRDPLTGLIVSVTDEAGQSQTFEYDARGNILCQREADGSETRFLRDSRGLPIKIIDAKGGVAELVWSADGLLEAYTDCSGKQTQYLFDADGRLTAMTNALGATTADVYDAVGNAIEARGPDGARELMGYDAAGRLVSRVDACGATTRYEWASDNQLIRRIDAQGFVWQQEYDAARRLIAIINEDGRRYAFGYDPLDRQSFESNFQGIERQYFHDADGHLIRQIESPSTPDAITTDIERDAMGKLLQRLLRAGDGQEQRVIYQHDALGRLVGAADENSRIKFEYDPSGRVLAEIATRRTGAGPLTTILRHEYACSATDCPRSYPTVAVSTT